MPVTVEVPTGAEIHAHIAAWEALPEGERPPYPCQYQTNRGTWLNFGRGFARFPTDDTPVRWVRLIPLPVPVGEGWRRPVDREEALAAGAAGVMEVQGRADIWAPGSKGAFFGEPEYDYRVPAGWAPGRERVEFGPKVAGRTVDGVEVEGYTTPLADDYPSTCLSDDVTTPATVIDGTPYVWVDPLPPEPETPETSELERTRAALQAVVTCLATIAEARYETRYESKAEPCPCCYVFDLMDESRVTQTGATAADCWQLWRVSR